MGQRFESFRNYKSNKRFCSSTGQSVCLRSRRLKVRILPRSQVFLERKLAYWGYWLTFPTVSREKRVRSSYKPLMVFLVYLVKSRNVNPKNRVRFPKTPKLYNWEDNDGLFTCFGCRRLQVRVLFLRLKAGMTEWHTRLI